jgi:Glycosyl transferase family 2
MALGFGHQCGGAMATHRPLQSDFAATPSRSALVRLSIITVSFNAASTLGDTLESVSRQRGADFEHWLVDGGSNDETPTIVATHGKHLQGYVSERDDGLYDAMNKGVALSSGDAIGFLNADDWYAGPDTLKQVCSAFASGADLVYGDLAFVSSQEPFDVRRAWKDRPHDPGDFFRWGWQPAHPTTFVRRALFDRVGGFDLRWRIAADYAFLARVMKEPGVTIRHVPQCLVNMRLGGASTSGPRAIWRANQECAQALREMGRWPWGTITMKVARKLPQTVVPRQWTPEARLWRPWSEQAAPSDAHHSSIKPSK